MKKFAKKYDIKSIILVLVSLLGPILIMGLMGFVGLVFRIKSNNFIFVLTIYFIIIILEMLVILFESNAKSRIKEHKKKGTWIANIGIIFGFLKVD